MLGAQHKCEEETVRPVVRAAIFDVDGTLVDSIDAHAAAWLTALEHHGYSTPLNQVRRLIGMGGDKIVPLLTGLREDDVTFQQISDLRERVFREAFLPRLRPFPGVRGLLTRIRSDGLKLVVASSVAKAELQALLEIAHVSDLIHHTVSSDDVANSKPDPDVVEAALRQTAVDRCETLMIGDTPYDIEAATRAGVDTIAFRCGGWNSRDLSGAIAMYYDAADLLAQYSRSPLGKANWQPQ